MTTTPKWLDDNPTERRPTEILVPVVMKVGPVWSHGSETGGWYAALEASGFADAEGDLWVCEHVHETPAGAWACVADAAWAAAEQLTRKAAR